MLLHDARSPAPQARNLRLPHCPQCGDALLAPLMAEHVNERHVRNHWACESCGHTFRRSHTFALVVDDTLQDA
jgi:ribosomal protein S27AE